MIWTNSPGQIAVAATIALVPVTVYFIFVQAFATDPYPGLQTAALAAGATLLWVLGISRPWLRAQLVAAIFADERSPPACARCGSTACQEVK